MGTTTAPTSFVVRLIGAAALDRAIYEEVEADRGATGQALVVVLASSVAAGIGLSPDDRQTLSSVVFFSTVALLTWAAWAVLTFEIGTRVLPEPGTRSDVGELLRTIGFAATPGVLRLLGVLPGVTIPVFAATTVWMLIAMIVAVRQALDYQSTTRAVVVCVMALFLALTMAIVLGVVFGPSVA